MLNPLGLAGCAVKMSFVESVFNLRLKRSSLYTPLSFPGSVLLRTILSLKYSLSNRCFANVTPMQIHNVGRNVSSIRLKHGRESA